MRKSKLTPDEIQAAEKAADERRYRRGMGFDLMDVRDRGGVVLDNGALMEWSVKRPPLEYEARRIIPDGHFVLRINKESAVFSADEFGKYFRWV